MPSTFDSLLRLELQASGENNSTWGTRTNTNLSLLADAIAGHVSISVAGSGDFTLSTANAATDQARMAFITLTGILTGNRTIIVPAAAKTYYFRRNTTGNFTLSVKTASGTSVALPASSVTPVVCDGTDCFIGAASQQYVDAQVSTVAASGVPTGAVMPYASSGAPTGWLQCAGQTVSRTTYATLFAAIGTTYGVGDGSTTFGIPDLRGRVVAGLDDMGGTAASRITVGGAGFSGTTRGAAGGSEALQAHTHAMVTAGSHGHLVAFALNQGGDNAGFVLGQSAGVTGDATRFVENGAHIHAITTAGTGAAQNVQPTIILNYIIKT